MGQLLLKMLVGVISALMIWMIFEPLAPTGNQAAWPGWEMKFIFCLGMAIGLTVGALNGWIQGSKIHMLRGAGLGLLFGGIGAPLGYQIGSALVGGIFGSEFSFVSPQYSMPTKVIARVIALTPIGIFLGAAIGASSLNTKRTVNGLVGGIIGAGFGGAVFDVLGGVLSGMTVSLNGGGHTGNTIETGSVPRALYAAMLGGLIALFIGIVDLVSRSAWVRLKLGRNEGKEWPIDAPQTFIGRNERANIPLFGDPNIAPMHACIIKQGNSYVINDGGSPVGTFVNGQRISSAALFHGAHIQVGSYALEFLMKHGAAPARGPENFNQAYAIQNQPQPAGAGTAAYAPAPGGYPTQVMPASPAGPAPGSLYGSQPTQSMPQQQMGFPAQQPTVAFQNPVSQPTVAYGGVATGGFALVGVDGPLIGQRFPVRGPIELGRESASVPMSFDTNASRRHAGVTPSQMGLVVTDLQSTNGTFVNGQRVQSANAGPGDLIRIGGTTFRVEPG